MGGRMGSVRIARRRNCIFNCGNCGLTTKNMARIRAFSSLPGTVSRCVKSRRCFYHRYLSLFVLEQYDAVIRDTQHNLDVLNLCSDHGQTEYDRMCLEQYRPYIIMMNTRAKACDALRQGFVQTAIAYLRGGIKSIAHLMPKNHRRKMLRESHEAKILLEMLKQIRGQLPPDPRVALRMRLDAAVKAEHYEEAAMLRDELGKMMMKSPLSANPASTASREEPSNLGASSMPPAMPKSAGVPAKKARKPRQKKTRGDSDGV